MPRVPGSPGAPQILQISVLMMSSAVISLPASRAQMGRACRDRRPQRPFYFANELANERRRIVELANDRCRFPQVQLELIGGDVDDGVAVVG
jgi:hypothetical protein